MPARRASSSRSSPRGTASPRSLSAARSRASAPRRASRASDARRRRRRADLGARARARARRRDRCISSTSCASSCGGHELVGRRPPRRAWRHAFTRAGAGRRATCSRARRARPAGAAAPAAQPRADPRDRRARAGAAAGRVLRHRLPPQPAGGGAALRPAARDHRRGRAALRLPRPVLRVHRRARCRSSTPARPRAGGRRASRQRRQHVRDRAGRSVATTMGFTAVDGLPMGTRCGALDPGVMLYLMDEHGMDARAIENADLQAVGAARRLRASRATCATLLGQRRCRARRAIDLFVYRIGRELGSLAAALAGSTRSSSPPASARTQRRSASGLPRRGLARRGARRGGQRRAAGRASAAGSQRVGLGHPHQRGADDRAPHAPARPGRGPRREAPARGVPARGVRHVGNGLRCPPAGGVRA